MIYSEYMQNRNYKKSRRLLRLSTWKYLIELLSKINWLSFKRQPNYQNESKWKKDYHHSHLKTWKFLLKKRNETPYYYTKRIDQRQLQKDRRYQYDRNEHCNCPNYAWFERWHSLGSIVYVIGLHDYFDPDEKQQKIGWFLLNENV